MTQQIDCADWIFIIHVVILSRSKQPAVMVQIPDFIPLSAPKPKIITITGKENDVYIN